MFGKIFLLLFITLQISSISSAPVGSDSRVRMTVREVFNDRFKNLDRYEGKKIRDIEFLRLEDRSCIEQKLNLTNPEMELSIKFLKNDAEAILADAALNCNTKLDEAIKEEMESRIEDAKRSRHYELDCFKAALAKTTPNSKLLDGFQTQQLANKTCKRETEDLEFMSQFNLILGTLSVTEADYPRCQYVNYDSDIQYCKAYIMANGSPSDEARQEFFETGIMTARNNVEKSSRCILNAAFSKLKKLKN